jgi:hypothetical protein
MKTTLRNIAMTVGLTAVLGSAVMFAGGKNRGIANIPLNFHVSGKTAPAGKYMFHSLALRVKEANQPWRV